MNETTVKQVMNARDTVGESIVWDESSNALLWIDIIGQRIHKLVLTSGEHRVWQGNFDWKLMKSLVHKLKLWPDCCAWL